MALSKNRCGNIVKLLKENFKKFCLHFATGYGGK